MVNVLAVGIPGIATKRERQKTYTQRCGDVPYSYVHRQKIYSRNIYANASVYYQMLPTKKVYAKYSFISV